MFSFSQILFHQSSLEITLYNVCSVHRGCSVHQWDTMSTSGGIIIILGDIMSTSGVFSTSGDIMMHVEDITSTSGGVQYIGVFSTSGDIMSTSGGYHDAYGGIP